MSNPEILDLDKIIPDKRIVKLAGKEIDVSKIPSRVTLEIAEKVDVLKNGSAESFPIMMDMVVKIMNNPDVDKDWIVDNTSVEQLLALLEFVIKPIQDKANNEQGGEGKNEESPKN